MKWTVAALIMMASAACFAAEPQAVVSLLSTVNVKDGISRGEATNIAKAYFIANVGCGAFVGIVDGHSSWIIEGKFGYAGHPIRELRIDKKSGAIRSSVGPSYATPNEMLKAVLPRSPAKAASRRR